MTPVISVAVIWEIVHKERRKKEKNRSFTATFGAKRRFSDDQTQWKKKKLHIKRDIYDAQPVVFNGEATK